MYLEKLRSSSFKKLSGTKESFVYCTRNPDIYKAKQLYQFNELHWGDVIKKGIKYLMIKERGNGQGICEHDGNLKIMAAQTPSYEGFYIDSPRSLSEIREAWESYKIQN